MNCQTPRSIAAALIAGLALAFVVIVAESPVAEGQQVNPPPPGGFGAPGGFGPPGFAMRPPGLVEASPAGLLGVQTVADELKLTPAQRESIELVTRLLDDALQTAIREVDFPSFMDLGEEEQAARLASWRKAVSRATADADGELVKLLEPAQARRLKELVLQRAGAQAFARDEVVAALKLTDEQQSQFAKSLPDGAGDPFAFGPPPRQIDVTAEMLAALTDAQRQQWTTLLGEKFEFPQPVQFPFGPGGPGGRGGPGGPFAAERKILDQFDASHDGWLDHDERAKAREWLADNPGAGRGGPGGFRGGRGGRGGPGGGRGGFGRRTEPSSPGPRVAVADVPPLASGDLYDQTVVRTLFLEFENDDWEQELETFHGTDVDVPATLTVDGKPYANVGVRFRGASSYMMLPSGSKRSLNLSLDLADAKQRLYGYKTLNLLNAHEDPTFMHTVLYSRIARQCIPAPKANFVRVVINGESWGLYSNAQQYDKLFIAENFPQDRDAKRTARWKVSGSPMGSGGLEYFGDDVAEYRRRFEIKSDDNERSWQALITLCRTLNETPVDELEAALEPLLDIEGALWFLALDNALINSDGYWIRASDYSLYLDAAGKFHVIPHDMNEALQPPMGPGAGGGRRGGGGRGPFGGGPGGFGGPPGGFGGPGGRAGAASYDVDPLVGLDDPSKPLRSKLLQVPGLRAKYLAHVREIADKQLDWAVLGPVVNAYAELIRPVVAADTRKLSSQEEFDESVSSAESGDAAAGRHSLHAFATQRREYLLKATGEASPAASDAAALPPPRSR